ncbi:MAG: thiamine-phosphate kinase [Gemmatimonadetes bacterium]|nr:thiamine-phosphate kinase [Gemmatimonadota bacterium]MBI3568211.1 thiamine-phosphate kinase [Gemmatimonadota bacterium]
MTQPHLSFGPGTEFDTVRAMLARWGSTAQGAGDDGALLDVPAGRQLVVSTDTVVEDVHFRRGWITSEEIAYRAGAAAISDLAAMGAEPLAMTIALTLPDAWRDQSMALADGIGAIARTCGMPIVGGDLSSGRELSIGVTVLGTVEPGGALTRAGAVAGQALWVTGSLGSSRLAVQAFERGLQPSATHRERFVHPEPRLREARWLAAHGATAAIDISDGVASDAAHVAAASRVSLTLHLDLLPLAPGASPVEAARSGEEYELLVAAPASLDAAAFERAFGVPLTRVGEVEAAGSAGAGVDTRLGDEHVPLPRGHDHFAR